VDNCGRQLAMKLNSLSRMLLKLFSEQSPYPLNSHLEALLKTGEVYRMIDYAFLYDSVLSCHVLYVCLSA
jgi:hypothetical protein